MLRYIKKSGLIITLLFVGIAANAQTAGVRQPILPDSTQYDPHNQMDVFDVAKMAIRKMFKKKPDLFTKKKPNENGPFITTIPYPGYAIATGFAAVLPINISFYTNKKEKGELSFFNSNFQYTQYKQVLAFSLSNLFFGHDKWELIGDWRYYNFPTYTYGLGSSTTLLDQDRINYSHLRVYEQVMHRVVKNLDAGIGYHLDYHWNIDDFNSDNGDPTDFQRYGYTKRSISSGLSVNLLYDSRNNPNNPYRGIYFNFQFRTNLKGLGGDGNWNSITVDCRKYVRLPTKWYLEMAFWGYLWVTVNGKPPYLDLPSTGWDMFNNTGRGYAMGRFRGLSMAYLETEFRFGIMRNGLLGGVVFFNAESLSQWPSGNFGTIQPGGGIGLRIKLNRRTNTNSAIDYGFGTGGSRGFAANLNEVF